MIWVWMPRQNPIPFDANPTLHLSHSKSFGPARSLPFAVGYCWYCVGVLEYYYIGYFLLLFFFFGLLPQKQNSGTIKKQ